MERRLCSFDCARLPKRFIPRKGTETARKAVDEKFGSLETIYTPQGDGNLDSSLASLRWMPKRFIPRKGTETKIAVSHKNTARETIYTPQGDGNLDGTLQKERKQMKRFIPRKGTET